MPKITKHLKNMNELGLLDFLQNSWHYKYGCETQHIQLTFTYTKIFIYVIF